MEIKGENQTPARSLLHSVRIGYAAHSRRKPASRYRQAVAGPRLLYSLSAALSAKIKIADINLLFVARSNAAALLDALLDALKRCGHAPPVDIGELLPP